MTLHLNIGNIFSTGQAPVDAPLPEKWAADFDTYYAEHIATKAGAFEDERQTVVRTYKQRLVYAVPVWLALAAASISAISYWQLDGQPFAFAIGVPGALGIAVFGWCWTPIHRYGQKVKRDIFGTLVTFFGEDFRFVPDGQLVPSSLEDWEILPGFTEEKTEDYVSGSYQGVSLELTEAELARYVRTKNGRRRKVVFDGVLLLLSMDKPFEGKTVVRQDKGRIGNWFGGAFDDLERIKLEDPIFEEEFEVYGTDQIEARFLLTPAFMERLLKLEVVLGSDRIQASFFRDQLFIAVPTKRNWFKARSAFKPVDFQLDCRSFAAEMNIIFSLIETLKIAAPHRT